MASPRATVYNRKLPPLPPRQCLAADDPRHWAVLLTDTRLRLRWTYARLAVRAGVSESQTIWACTTGRCTAHTLLRLMDALSLRIPTPSPLTGTAAQTGHREHVAHVN